MKLVAIVGTNSDRSTNRKLLKFMQKHFSDKADIEDDHTIPAPLASVLEWIAYTSRALINKPTMIVGASLGLLGTSRAQAHLRQILDAPELKARVMPGTEFLLGHSEQVLDDDNHLNNPEKVAELEEHFSEFQNFVELTKALVKPEDTNRKKSFIWEEWLKA